jgi:hypothetical protein
MEALYVRVPPPPSYLENISISSIGRAKFSNVAGPKSPFDESYAAPEESGADLWLRTRYMGGIGWQPVTESPEQRDVVDSEMRLSFWSARSDSLPGRYRSVPADRARQLMAMSTAEVAERSPDISE